MIESERSFFRDGRSTQFLVFIPLVDRDEENKPQPRLLERWEHSDDYTQWTFHLRRDVRWHDGKPVTAHDVKFTLELLTDPNISYEYRVFEEIAVIDDFTCRLRSSKPFDALIYSWYGVCPKHVLEGLDTETFYYWDFWNQPVGNGPYRYARHISDAMVELEANPDYYGEKPRINRVVLKLGKNPIPELLSGNVDAVHNISPVELRKIGRNHQYNTYHEFAFNRVIAIVWNHRHPLFHSAEVRRACTHAINRRELTQLLNLPVNTPVFDVAMSLGQAHRGEIPAPLPYDPELAGRILTDAGWLEQGEGEVRLSNGREFRFTLIVGEELQTAAVYIQDQFKKVGIRMAISVLERNIWKHRERAGEYDAILSGIFPYDYSKSLGGYDNPEFYRLLEAAAKAPSVEDFDLALRTIWPIYRTDMPCTFLFPQVIFNIVRQRIRGLESPQRTDPAKFMEYLWIEDD